VRPQPCGDFVIIGIRGVANDLEILTVVVGQDWLEKKRDGVVAEIPGDIAYAQFSGFGCMHARRRARTDAGHHPLVACVDLPHRIALEIAKRQDHEQMLEERQRIRLALQRLLQE